MTLRILHETIRFSRTGEAVLQLKCTERQLQAAIVLYKVIVRREAPPDEDQLFAALHSFFATLLESGGLSVDTIACPTDQVLFLVSIRPDGGYCSAVAVEQGCSGLRYCFLAIFVHVVRLKMANSDKFTWFERMSPGLNQDGFQVNAQRGSAGDAQPMENTESEDLEEVLERILHQTYASKPSLHLYL